MLFATPELLTSDSFLPVLRGLQAARALALVAIDEAHCISSWGHDFRTAYRRLGRLRHELPGCPIMALTATASSRVQEDVIAQLRLERPLVLKASFDRPEIEFQGERSPQRACITAAGSDGKLTPRCCPSHPLHSTSALPGRDAWGARRPAARPAGPDGAHGGG